MRRLVGRDVLGAPRAGGRPSRAHRDVHARTGTPMPRARGRPRCTHGDVPGTRAAGDVAPTTNAPWPPCARAAPAGGRDAPAGRARRPRRAARRGTSMPRARGRPCAHGDVHAARMGTSRGRGPPGTSAPTMRYQANAWLFQKFPCIRRTPYRGNILRESHPLSDILVFYRMSPTFPILSVCSVAAKPFCVFCAVVARHAGRRNHISLCPNLRMRSICVP